MKLLDPRKRVPVAPAPERIRLVVIENDAGECDLHAGSSEDAETIVVAQHSGESTAHLTLRVASRIGTIAHSGRVIGRAIVFVGHASDESCRTGRWSIARTILAHMLEAGGGELTFDADATRPNVRDELLSLVEALLEAFEQVSVPIRLRFRGNAPRATRPSGIRPIGKPLRRGRQLKRA